MCGQVTAALDWGQPAETMEITAPEEGSYSDVLHRALPFVQLRFGTDLNAFWLLLTADGGDGDRRRSALRRAFGTQRRQRAIGVVYRREAEATSHYVRAAMAKQFDVWVHIDRTTALTPLD